MRPLEDYDTWIEIESCSEIPKNIRDISKNIYELSNKIKFIDYNDELSIKYIFESLEILSIIISDFQFLFQYSAELIGKNNDDIFKIIKNDLINMRKEIELNINNLILRPSERIPNAVFLHIKYLLSEPINSLIGIVLIHSYDKSWSSFYKELNFLSLRDSNKNEPDNGFYEVLYNETIKRAGQHPMFNVFKSPIKTVASPVLSSTDKRNVILGIFEEIKKGKKDKKGSSEEKSEEEKLIEKYLFDEEEND